MNQDDVSNGDEESSNRKRHRDSSSEHPTPSAEPRKPSFGSISSAVSPTAVVEALNKVMDNAQKSTCALSKTTCVAIERTRSLLRQSRGDSESKADRNARVALGRKHALVIFALLVDGEQHVGDMERLSKGLVDDPSGKSFDAFMNHWCLAGSHGTDSALLLRLASNGIAFDISGFKALIPPEKANVCEVLSQRGLLLVDDKFGNCKIWAISRDGFDRHIKVDRLIDVTIQSIQAAIDSNRAALVGGESGSGKTFSSILSAGDGLCIFLAAAAFLGNDKNWDQVEELLRNERDRHVAGPGAGSVPAAPSYLCDVLERLISPVVPRVGAAFDGRVVLVVDEVGGHPLVVRSLCRETPAIVAMLKRQLNITSNQVGVVVCGTGSETCDEPLGSIPSTYVVISCVQVQFTNHVISLMDAHGLCSLAGMLLNKPIVESYYPAGQERAPSLAYVQRLLTNRRFAAALLERLKGAFHARTSTSGSRQVDATVPWLTVLPWMTSVALLEFKRLNGLAHEPFDSLRMHFADALALCFGGHNQTSCAESGKLHRSFGMIVDNARMVARGDAEFDLPGSSSSGDYVLALPKSAIGVGPHFGRRFSMGPATLEMGLQGFSLNTAARARSGDGLEDTAVDFMYCWALACCSKVPITLPGEAPPATMADEDRATAGNASCIALLQDKDENDAVARQALVKIMMEIRDKIRAENVGVVLRVTLTEWAKTVDKAVAAAFAEAWNMTHEEGVPFVIVVRSAPKAPFADVFVVGGVTSSGAGPHAPTMFVAIQLKHFTSTKLTDWEALGEHLKQGCPVFKHVDGRMSDAVRAKLSKKKKEAAQGAGGTEVPTKAAEELSYSDVCDALKTCKSFTHPYLFVSLVLVLYNDDFQFTTNSLGCAVEQFAGMTTVRIRSGALRSVMHPIALGSDPQRTATSGVDCEKTDFRTCQVKQDLK